MADLVPDSLLPLLEPYRFAVLLSGVIFGFLAGILPGIGGRVGLALALPFAVAFDPLTGAVFLLAMHSVVHTSGSITPIAYGLPTSASDAATAIDGFKLQQMGRGSQALGASLTASSIGGILGAIAFIVAAPVVRLVLTNLGAPEFLLLSLLGLSSVAILSGTQIAGGVAVTALGILASSVGLDPLTAVSRFTFGRLELWDGLQLVAVVGGLFVVPEMLSLARAPAPSQMARTMRAEFFEVLRGMAVALRHRVVLIRGTIVGIAIGMMPGAGSSVAVWLAYADAARISPDKTPVGAGSLAGVIAPEAANNAKEGGALIPTIYFGIPGSSSMAILIGGLVMLGLEPGPRFLGPDIGTAGTFAWAIVLGNLLTIPLFLATVPLLVGLTAPRPGVIVPFALVAILTVIVSTNDDPFVVAQFVLGSALGILLRAAGLARAPFLLGFVLGPSVEKSLSKTVEIFGFDALHRPGVIGLAIILLFVLVRVRRPGSVPTPDENFSPAAAQATFVSMMIVAVAAIATGISYPETAGLAPVAASVIVLVAAAFGLARLPSRKPTKPPEFATGMGAAFVSLVVATPLVGLIPATTAFLYAARRSIGGRSPTMVLAFSILAAVTAQLLFSVALVGRNPDFGLLGDGLASLVSHAFNP